MGENTKTPLDVQLDQILKDKFSFTFETPESGIYFIEITASAKNKKQNIYPEWAWRIPLLPVQSVEGKGDDADLYVTIDGQEFPKLDGVRGLRNAPAAWSGASLKNTPKTNVFVLSLEKGSHKITFYPEESPTLQKISCEKLKSPQSLNYPPKYNNPPDKKERNPWYTFALVDLPLIQIGINATVAKRKKWLFFSEDDDVKIILDGNIQKNEKENAHKNWFFCARATEGAATFTAKPRWEPKLHYVELFADWTPTLNEATFNLVQSYNKYLDRNYDLFDKEILAATTYWNAFFSKQNYPPEELLDPDLVKAMVYRESKLGYYPDENIIDVMQVWDPENPAKDTLLGETPESEFISPEEIGYIGYSYPLERTPPKVESREESIFWGVRWLYHKAQRLKEEDGKVTKPYVREWLGWREAVWNYNANRQLVEDYVNEVFLIYEEGIDDEGSVLWES